MKFGIHIVAFAALASAAANNRRHLHRRDPVETIVQTAYDIETVEATVVVDDDSATTIEPSSTEPVATTAVAPTTTAIAVDEKYVESSSSSTSSIASATAVVSSSVVSSSTAAPISYSASSSIVSSSVVSYSASSSSSSASASSTGSSTLSSNGGAPSGAGSAGSMGITYSPYTDSGSCKTVDQIKADIEKLSGYNLIRLYSVDCSGVEGVVSALAEGQELFAGLYYMDNLATDIASMKQQLDNAGKDWSIVNTVAVGNELVNSGSASASQIEGYVATAKAALTSAGYSGSIVSVDTLVAVRDNTELCNYSDYIAVNSHPYFDGGVTAEDAGSWLLEQIEYIYGVCGSSKNVVITETGWPHSGDTNGVAVPSVANQQAALDSIKEKTGASVFLFTVYNDYWKSPGAYNVEQAWGIYGDSPE